MDKAKTASGNVENTGKYKEKRPNYSIAYFFTLLFTCALAQESSQIHIYNSQIFYRKCTNIAKEKDPYIHTDSFSPTIFLDS
jgi:hypothetical protein